MSASEFPASSGDIQRELSREQKAAYLQGRIEYGLGLVVAGQGELAQDYFMDPGVLKYAGLIVARRLFAVDQLLCQDDVEATLRSTSQNWSLATNASKWRVTMVDVRPQPIIAMGTTGQPSFTRFSDFPERYDPQLVHEMRQGIALTRARPLLSALRKLYGAPLMGYDSETVDSAAFIAERGIRLSAEYLTRTDSLLKWANGKFPGR